MLRLRLLIGTLVGLLAACGGGGAPVEQSREQPLGTTDPLRRVTTYGPVLGAANAQSGTYEWLGVPYAKPPVGALRWAPPVAPAAWTETRKAQAFGAPCVQGGRFFSPSPNGRYDLSVRDGLGKLVGAEDCLTLNVWSPAGARGPLPVMVFFHGGSNISGYAADPIYHGAALAAKARAVVVTVNYRLGLHGWLDLPQLKTGDPVVDSGNFGLLDHIRSLQYLRDNVAAFGGDPANITIMGESAGAVNVWALLVSPQAGGLFHKAVSMSGGIQTADPATPRVYATQLLHQLLIADGKASNDATAAAYLLLQTKQQVAAYVRSKTAQELLEAEQAVGRTAPAVFADGHVVPLSPTAAILAGQYHRVPVLAGNTNEEGKLFGAIVGAYKPNDYDRFTLQYEFDPDAPPTLTEADLINPQYLPVDMPGTGWNYVSAALGHAVFTRGTLESMNALSSQQPQQSWYYRFDWNQEPVPFNTVYGAVHAMDLPFAFGNFGRSVFSFAFSTANKPGREALSDAMMRTLGAFAATGNPQHAGLGATWGNWPAKIVFDASLTETRIRTEP